MRYGERVEPAVPMVSARSSTFRPGRARRQLRNRVGTHEVGDRPHLTESMRGAGSGAGARVLVLPGLVLGDLLRAAAAEQPRAGEPLHDLPHVLDGVHQVVDVGAYRPEGLQDREDVLV